MGSALFKAQQDGMLQRMLGWIGWLVMVLVIGMSFVYEQTAMADEVWCWFRRTTALSCPGCGLTRSFCSMARGAVGEAFAQHLAGPWLWSTSVFVIVWRPVRHGRRWPSLWQVSPRLMHTWFVIFAVLFGIQICRAVIANVAMMTQ